MDEYIANGVRLGWLINPETKRVHIYRPEQPVEILEAPTEVSGEPELPGFVLDLREIWEPNI
jgi:Uma2 family endonuclease